MCDHVSRKFACIVASLVLVLGLAAASPAADATSKPASKPTTRRTSNAGKLNDAWMSAIALDELNKAGGTREYAQLEKSMRNLCLARLTCGCLDDLSALSDVVYVLHACQYLPRAITLGDDGAKMAKMLVADRDLSRLLFRAIPDDAGAAKAMENLLELWKADPKAVAEYPNFTVAAVLVAPLKEPNGCTLLQAFQWYTSGKNKLHNDLKKMPYELAQYLADSRLSIPERQWAVQNYFNRPNPALAYFDVKTLPSNSAVTKQTVKKDSIPYTLANLPKMTDLDSGDQAYFASEICKAVGVPAAVVTGTADLAVGNSWVDCVKAGANGYIWDDTSGRFPFARNCPGTVSDPLTNETIPDCQMVLIGAAAQLPLARSEQADCTIDLARMVALAGQDNLRPDFDAADKLVQAYNERLADKKPKVDPNQTHGDEKLGVGLVDDLLAAGLERNLVHRGIWQEIVNLQKSGCLPADRVERYLRILTGKTFAEYPDFSASLLLKIIPAIGDPAVREQDYLKAFSAYPKRQDLQGQILLVQGDDYLQQSKSKTDSFDTPPSSGKGPAHDLMKTPPADDMKMLEKAYKTYEKAALLCINTISVVVPAAERMEKIMIQQNHRDKVLGMYTSLFQKTSKSKNDIDYDSYTYRGATSCEALGKKVVQLLEDSGKSAEAAALKSSLADWSD